MGYQQEKQVMIDSQLRPNSIQDSRLLLAYESLPRHNFVDSNNGYLAYTDKNHMIGEGRYMLEPMIEAQMLQLADINENDLVLIIGAFPGNMAGIAGLLSSAVIAIESNLSLVSKLQEIYSKLSFSNIVVSYQEIKNGFPARGPYDVILFGAAVPTVSDVILNQLAENGRLIAIERSSLDVPGKLCKYQKNEKGYAKRIVKEVFTPILPEFKNSSETFQL